MTDTTLLPCPSCGTAPGQNGPWLNPDSWYVACQKCGLSTRDFDTDAEAIAAWNRRPSPSVHRQASAGQEGVTDVWDYEVMSVDGQWCHESRTGEAPDCEMFVIRNLRKRTPLDTPRLQQLFGDAIEGALAFGFQGNNPPPEGHWLWRFWNIGRAEATKATALSTAAPESGTSSDDLKQRLVDSIVRHCVDGKVWAPMAEAWARHAVNEAFDGIAAPTAGETL